MKTGVAVALLLLAICWSSLACPLKCICSGNTVSCIKVGLKVIPSDIPVTIHQLDVSNNPQLKVKLDSFLKFTQLQILKMEYCGLSEPVLLPESLTEVVLRKNKLTLDCVRTMFNRSSIRQSNLHFLDLSFNDIQFENALNVLPPSLTSLILSYNWLKKIGPNDFQQFRKLRTLEMEGCSISTIAKDAFKPLPNLRKLSIQLNSIRNLPVGIFASCSKLRYLKLDGNELESMPDFRGIPYLLLLDVSENHLQNVTSEDLSMRYIAELNLNGNRITFFNLSKTMSFEVDLSNNRLSQVHDMAFGSKRLRYLFLHKNQIKTVSPKAFSGVEYISELYLHRNQIKYLPQGVFQGVAISKLVLYGNKLTNMTGVLNGMKRAPDLLLLFSNPNLQHLKASDYVVMSNTSSLYLTCQNLKEISALSILQANIKCVPLSDYVIETASRVLGNDGYQCNWIGKTVTFHCHPCSIGMRDTCSDSHCTGTCKKCPPGSFYQDEVASTACKKCPVGQYVPPGKAPGKSPLDCLTCPKGTDTEELAWYRACSCLEGFARLDRFGECTRCNKTGIECKRDYPVLKKGYWMTWKFTKAKKTWTHTQSCKEAFRSFTKNLDTRTNDYDRKTTKFECEIPLPQKCPIPGSCLGGIDAYCSVGYKQVLCAVCDEGYMKDMNRCIRCPKPPIALLQLIGYFFIFVLLCFLLSWIEGETRNRTNSDEHGASSSEQRNIVDIILSSLKILLGFYQVLSGIISAMSKTPWPKALQRAAGYMEYLELEIFRIPSLRCIKHAWTINAVQEFKLAVIATGCFPVLILLYVGIKACYIYFKNSYSKIDEFKKRLKNIIRNCLRSVALFLFATYPITSRRIARVLPMSCHKFCTNELSDRCIKSLAYLRSDYSVECLDISHENKQVLKSAYAALLIPFGLPFLLLILLWIFAPKPEEKKEKQQGDNDIAKNDETAPIPCLTRGNDELQQGDNHAVQDDERTPLLRQTRGNDEQQQGDNHAVQYDERTPLLPQTRGNDEQQQGDNHTVEDDERTPLRHRTHGNDEQTATVQPQTCSSDTEEVARSALRFAYENYKASCWYWEVIEMVRKLLLTVGIVFFLQHTKVGLGGIIVVAMAFTVLQAAKNPMKDPFENFLQLLSLSIIPVNLAIGAVLQSHEIGAKDIIEERKDSWALGLLLVVLNSLVVFLIVCRFLRIIIMKVCCKRRV